MMNMDKEKLKELIGECLKKCSRPVIAIDGMAAAGKSTLAAELARDFGGEVVHMDDFFLPAELRTPERLQEAGGNVHYERFAAEVASAVRAGRAFDYGVFNCSEMMITGSRHVENKGLLIVEGTYCLRAEFVDLYDLKIFMKIDEKTQMERIVKRNGPQKARVFKERWIPMETLYFKSGNVERRADFVV